MITLYYEHILEFNFFYSHIYSTWINAHTRKQNLKRACLMQEPVRYFLACHASMFELDVLCMCVYQSLYVKKFLNIIFS